VTLGAGAISVRRLLALSPGSVIRLDQSAGGDLHIVSRGVMLASGEVVIVEDTIAVRVTSLMAHTETL
jgi:flagellar motor switch protein FliN/FliY